MGARIIGLHWWMVLFLSTTEPSSARVHHLIILFALIKLYEFLALQKNLTSFLHSRDQCQNKGNKAHRSSIVHFARSRCTQVPPYWARLLQGLITNDINELGAKEVNGEKYQRAALYTLFLSPKAKIISDAFLFTPRMITKGKAEYAKE